jgi:hypothetical protein
MINFRKHYIENPETKKRCRVWYSLDNRIDGEKCVTIYAKGYNDYMDGIIDFGNGTDTQCDHFEKDIARIFEDSPIYPEARKFVESLKGIN